MTRTWLFGCILMLGLAAAPAALALQGEVVSVTVHGPSLEGNLLGASADRAVAIYLPPGYDAAGTVRYPVIYLLHRLDGNEHSWWSAASYVATDTVAVTDKLIATRTIQPVILVMPNASTRYGACFYANTPVCGNWEDFVAQDLVAYVDTHYRTVARAGGRAIAGDGAGGYGALLAAMKHPDLFAAAYALSPLNAALPEPSSSTIYSSDAFAMTAPDRAMGLQPGSSLEQAQLAMAAVASPNPDHAPYYVDLPFQQVNGQMELQETVWQAWTDHTLVHMLADFGQNLTNLRALGVDASTQEDFQDATPDTRTLHEALLAAGIPHRFEIYTGARASKKVERMASIVLPFLAGALDGDAAATGP